MSFCKIKSISWGTVVFEMDGQEHVMGDVILCGNMPPVAWNWKSKSHKVDTSVKEPLRHSPGIEAQTIAKTLSDLDGYACRKCLIISQGVHGQLPVKDMPEYNPSKYTIYAEKTNSSLIDKFNKLNNGKDSVCALLLHTTC